MSNRSIELTKELYDYLLAHSLRESDVQKSLRNETADHPLSSMQIAPEQGQFMALLAKLIGARMVLEVGVFTGYSSLSVALALPENGKIVACDISEEYTAVARKFWKKAGVESKIELRIGPAGATLNALLDEGLKSRFDMAFIDADKTSYKDYYEKCLLLVRSGGVILLDNMLRSGRVADESVTDPNTVAIRALNEFLHTDDRVDVSLIPLADGLTLARKR